MSAANRFRRDTYLDFAVGLEEHERDFDVFLRRMAAFRPLQPADQVFEVGVGTGWFLIQLQRHGFPNVAGIEHNPQYVEHAKALGREHGVELDIASQGIEAGLPSAAFDVVVAQSVFEHVPDYEAGLRACHSALRPGGALYFYSTNKWVWRSGEFPQIPGYSWLPYKGREMVRVRHHGGRHIVEAAGVDFNQFTHHGLARVLQRIGFREVHDLVDIWQRGEMSPKKQRVLASAPGRWAARTFASGTCFICRK
jgi:SAM-dependent methyltransferase